MTDGNRKIAIIGFGEVGARFSKEFVASGLKDVTVYDILFDRDATRHPLAQAARSNGVSIAGSAAEAARDARIVFSAVTAASAYDVAAQAGGYLRPGQIFVDLNSVSPATKRKDAAAVEQSGADYVEAAVMSPIKPYGIKVPITLGGKASAEVKRVMDGTGMKLTLGDNEIGRASALKMCRSVMVKGFEALATECLLAARLYGVEEGVLESLQRSYPGMNWEDFAGYKIGRLLEHGRRRAAEMRESADTVAEIGMTPLMASAIAERIDWVADAVDQRPALREAPDAEWRNSLDQLAEIHRLDRLGSTER
ncbi:tartronate semialdehyde reductase [Pigmentiphaga humi]|uniref:Tartronate semialdehyde reductase n=1 Tax=Pigmentiphaga humi TaxID=2478468 RepID=A0A3P4B3E2_9BURK|nr:DUF1932 domain-containing protein [Pigmentiphaga humi]VCU70562.1 tartronate semialdehyde reductase [Pigmentiphaga humi]